MKECHDCGKLVDDDTGLYISLPGERYFWTWGQIFCPVCFTRRTEKKVFS